MDPSLRIDLRALVYAYRFVLAHGFVTVRRESALLEGGGTIRTG